MKLGRTPAHHQKKRKKEEESKINCQTRFELGDTFAGGGQLDFKLQASVQSKQQQALSS